jgi:DNA-directed RNA polymerase specialized sigma24 family protein
MNRTPGTAFRRCAAFGRSHREKWLFWIFLSARKAMNEFDLPPTPEDIVRHRPLLLKKANQLTGDPTEAEDLVQATFAKTLESLDQVRDMATLRAWMLRVQKNLWAERCRKCWRVEYRDPLHIPEEGDDTASKEADADEGLGFFLLLYLSLPDDLLDTLNALADTGGNLEQSAGMLGCSSSAIRKRRDRIVEVVEDCGVEDRLESALRIMSQIRTSFSPNLGLRQLQFLCWAEELVIRFFTPQNMAPGEKYFPYDWTGKLLRDKKFWQWMSLCPSKSWALLYELWCGLRQEEDYTAAWQVSRILQHRVCDPVLPYYEGIKPSIDHFLATPTDKPITDAYERKRRPICREGEDFDKSTAAALKRKVFFRRQQPLCRVCGKPVSTEPESTS